MFVRPFFSPPHTLGVCAVCGMLLLLCCAVPCVKTASALLLSCCADYSCINGRPPASCSQLDRSDMLELVYRYEATPATLNLEHANTVVPTT